MPNVENELDIVQCEIVFENDGIQLNTSEPTGQGLNHVLARISGEAAPQGEKPIIKVSWQRKTHLIFYSRSVKWLFNEHGPALSLVNSQIGALENPGISHNRRTVWATFSPNSNATSQTQVEYKLSLFTSVSNKGVLDSQVIITIDPIIETSRG